MTLPLQYRLVSSGTRFSLLERGANPNPCFLQVISSVQSPVLIAQQNVLRPRSPVLRTTSATLSYTTGSLAAQTITSNVRRWSYISIVRPSTPKSGMIWYAGPRAFGEFSWTLTINGDVPCVFSGGSFSSSSSVLIV
ncbi:hypothetical protein HMN09_00791600 [Mycena chlorophos]|uniref:Uncharacterized protein n=1 Tax=Mycena chlorophos TaxID=658473 RepID=A0A8H6SUB5_MYCCL|nr:hypothetical protein HMN09_00791600 [Mycena chlorophos]